MDRLPAEVLLSIFRLLHPIEKRECLLVCRRWQEVIQSNCLWHTVLFNAINKNTDSSQLDALMKNMKAGSGGDQTQQLIIETCIKQGFDLNAIALAFPRLRLFYYQNEYWGDRDQTEIDPTLFKSWQDHLETIIEYKGYSLVPPLLSIGPFYRVTKISLNSYYRDQVPYSDKHIFNSFKNVPALSVLSLEYFNLLFEDYELLHENTPALTTLTLYRTTIKDSDVPSIISPATKLKHFYLRDSFLRVEKQFDWVKYIIQKYVNLHHFSFNCETGGDQPEDMNEKDYYIQVVQPLIQRLGSHQLTMFGVKGHSILPESFDLLDKTGYQLRNIKFSTNDIIPFTEKLVSSNQINYLATLSITWSNYIRLASFKPLLHLESLKLKYQPDVELTDYDLPAYHAAFNYILDICPDNLKKLELRYIDLIINPAIYISKPKLLQSLKLRSVRIHDDLSQCIRTYCPRLREINIDNARSKEITFYLPDMDIFLFETNNKNKTYLLLEIDNEPYAYDGLHTKTIIRQNLKKYFGNCNLSVYPAYKLSLSMADTPRTMINLTCQSLSTLFIDGRVVL